MFDEPTQLLHLRFPRSMVDEMELARHALEKPSLVEMVRDAVRAYLDANESAIRAFKRLRERHGSD